MGIKSWILAVALALTGPALPSAASEAHYWPIYEKTDESLTVLYPLFVKQETFAMVFPFYAQSNCARDHHFLWPLLKISDQDFYPPGSYSVAEWEASKTGPPPLEPCEPPEHATRRLTRLAPLYFSPSDKEFNVVPLFRKTTDYTIVTTPPSYFSERVDRAFVFPFWVRGKDWWFAVPNIYANTTEDGSLSRLRGFGLFDYTADSVRFNPGEQERALYGADCDDESVERELTVLFYPKFRWGACRTLYRLPLFSWQREVELKRFYFVNFIYKEGKSEHEIMFFPLFGTSTNFHGTERSLQVLLYHHETVEDQRVQTSLFPFFSTRTHQAEESEFERSWWELFFLYEHRVQPSTEPGRTRRYHRFLIFSDEYYESEPHTFRILGLAVL